MILPTKHIKIAESLLGLGGYLLSILERPMNIDALWKEFSKTNNTRTYPAYHTFDNVILALNYLYMIEVVDIDQQGKIYNAINRT